MNPITKQIQSISLTQDKGRVNPQGENAANPALGFQQVLFSKHASLRLNDRNINLTDDQMNRVADGVEKAEQKGIRDSLVLVDDVALLVNVKSRTVITAVSPQRDNVFSDIDGAVIV